ncbi:MAG: ribonuclease HI [Patescibacteria group bacterium]
MKSQILIYADGSSLGNPGPGGWGAVVVYHDDKLKIKSVKLKVRELGGGEKHTTNNRMELTAAIEAIKTINNLHLISNKIILRTDSRYVINGITKWIKRWQKSGWIGKNKKPILNQDLWVKLSKIAKNKNIKWEHVHGHTGIAGNERADFIATLCAKERQFKTQKFFDGPLAKYPFDILSVKEPKKKSVSKNRPSGKKAYSYLSFVSGVLMRHSTWPECEKRVKGVSGAKFKKAFSGEDEENIIREWNLK